MKYHPSHTNSPEHPARHVHDHFKHFIGRITLLSPGEDIEQAVGSIHDAWADTVDRLHMVTLTPRSYIGDTIAHYTAVSGVIRAALTQDGRYAEVVDSGPLYTDDNTSDLQHSLLSEIVGAWCHARDGGLQGNAYGIIGVVPEHKRELLLPAPHNRRVTPLSIAVQLADVSLGHVDSEPSLDLNMNWQQLHPATAQ